MPFDHLSGNRVHKLKSYVMKIISVFLILILACSSYKLNAQEPPKTPDILSTGTLVEQMNYLDQRTNVYNNYRAVREDIFQKIKKNSLDSLLSVKNKLTALENQIVFLNASRDSVFSELVNTRNELETAVTNRDRLFLLGIPMNKVVYNAVMWGIIAGLASLLFLVFILFKRCRINSSEDRKELNQLKQEFEDYRQTSRKKMEQMVISHFNEIKKIKGE